MAAQRGRGWCFTWNNYTNYTGQRLCEPAAYEVHQSEIAPTTGTPHVQGYVYFKNARKLAQVKALLPAGVRLTVADGTADQNRVYCTREDKRDPLGTVGEYGTMPGAPGERMDLKRLKTDLDAGMSLPDVADTHFSSYLRYGRMIANYQVLRAKPRAFQTTVSVLWGAPGSGKSRHAMAVCDSARDYFWVDKPNGSGSLWFDGYCGQEVLVIDEFWGWVTRDWLCRLIDRYPLKVQTKGGTVNFCSPRVIITSNLHPEDWYPKIRLGPLKRRLTTPIGTVTYVTHRDFPDMDQYLLSLEKAPDQMKYFGTTSDYEDLGLSSDSES